MIWLVSLVLFVSETLSPQHAPEPLYTDMKLSEEYSVSLFACHIAQRAVKLLEMEEGVLHGRPIILVRGDRDYNGVQDMGMIFDFNEGRQSIFPHYYIYDMNFDGLLDKAYRDRGGNGVCQEMEEVPVGYLMQDGKQS